MTNAGSASSSGKSSAPATNAAANTSNANSATSVFLIIVNVIVFMHTSKLWQESIPHDIDPRTFNYKDFDFTKTPFYKFTVKWGLVPADLARGKTIGVATYMFLHGDIIHLIGNMIVLWAFVGTLE